MMHYWNYDLGYGMNPGFSIIGFLFQILFWGLVIMLIVKLFGHKHHRCGEHEMTEGTDRDRSLDIAKERYAKGEIDKKEFEQLKKDLS